MGWEPSIQATIEVPHTSLTPDPEIEKNIYRISSYSFRGNYSFEFGNPKVTVHKAKGHNK